MSARAPLPPEADANQRRASDPGASAWVSASAGTGKTEVLVKRVLRLLLDGSSPESILCLTYTKTAAAEMQNRLLSELAAWATDKRECLTAKLKRLTGQTPEEGVLRLARRLFARALEAKGGLKIHTIHGFCERLLQRFPLEAGVTPHFSVLDEREQKNLLRVAFDVTLARAAEDSEGPLGRALATVMAFNSGDYVRQVVEAVIGKRGELAGMAAYHDGRADWAEAERLVLKRLFGVGDESEDTLMAKLACVLSDAEIDQAIAAFAALCPTAGTDKKAEACLRQASASEGEPCRGPLGPVSHSGGKAANPDFHQRFCHGRARACRAARGSASPLRHASRHARSSPHGGSERRRPCHRRRRAGRVPTAEADGGRARL
jgi:ATP-dependent helicase/nuclease subunit A